MLSTLDAYLDIETTGLSPSCSVITVIGIYLVCGQEASFVQVIGDKVTRANLLEHLGGISTLYTYNGSRFDLPFIAFHLGINLAEIFHHHDLMYDCWRSGLRGGLKCVEQQLGIGRMCRGIDGYQATRLWWQYITNHDDQALATLLTYNREDVVNLKVLKEILLKRCP